MDLNGKLIEYQWNNNGKSTGFLGKTLGITWVHNGLENRNSIKFFVDYFSCYGRAMVFKPSHTGQFLCNFCKYFINVYG